MDANNKIYTIATLLNTALLVGCTVYLLVNGAPKSVQAPTTTAIAVEEIEPVSEPPKQISRGPRKKIDGIEGLFLDIMDPVKRAALDHQADPALYLPSDEELSKAIASNSLDSSESVVVLDKLKKGYAEYNMPFPSLSAPPPPSDPTQPEPVSSGDPKELEAWMKPTIQRLKDESKARGDVDISSFLPSDDEMKQAIESGSFEAPVFVRVREKIERGYQELQVPFPTPGQPQTAPGEPNAPTAQSSTQEMVAEQQIINAYFQGQLQRIKLESKKQDKDVSDCFPSSADMKKAVQTGSISSEESLAVISSLEGCYKSLDIPFHPPVRK